MMQQIDICEQLDALQVRTVLPLALWSIVNFVRSFVYRYACMYVHT